MFHAQFGGDVYPEEFSVYRATNYSSNGGKSYYGKRITPKSVLEEMKFYDEFDEEVYRYAVELFKFRSDQYNIDLM